VQKRKLPSHAEIAVPLLRVLDQENGMRAKDAAQAVALELQIDPDLTTGTDRLANGEACNLWNRRVRWVRQSLIRDGLVAAPKFNWWEASEKGRQFLHNCRPGVIITVFETESGQALWAEAETAAAHIHDESIDLILTSPEYPLVRPKSYGNRTGQAYLDWLTDLAAAWKAKLKSTGSLVLNLQDVYEPGKPTLQLYQEKLVLRLVEELGWHLCQKLIWHSPSKIPCTDWVTVKRIRITNGFETFYWFGKTPYPKASNLRVLRPYRKTMLRTLAQGGDSRPRRPGDHGHLTPSFHRNHGGSIPNNVIVASNSASNDHYCRSCREDGLPIHPGRFPDAPVEFFIKLLTEEGDSVYDPLAGSLKVGEVAERMGRRWLANEKSLTYLYGARHRFAKGNWLGPQPHFFV
jgi:DNA modification methylase